MRLEAACRELTESVAQKRYVELRGLEWQRSSREPERSRVVTRGHRGYVGENRRGPQQERQCRELRHRGRELARLAELREAIVNRAAEDAGRGHDQVRDGEVARQGEATRADLARIVKRQEALDVEHMAPVSPFQGRGVAVRSGMLRRWSPGHDRTSPT
jgi:hypothetical protein